MEQFIKLDINILKDETLTTTDAIIYSLLCDRMESSRKRKSFYDETRSDYYVIYTIEEVKTLLNISKGTAVKSFKKLEKNGLVVKKRGFNTANLIFLPHYSSTTTDPVQDTQSVESSKTEPAKVQKMESNQTKLNHTNITYNTNHTEPADFESDKIKTLTEGLIQNGGFDPRTAHALAAYSFGDSDKLHAIVGTIYKAKNAVLNKNGNTSDAKLALTLEYNEDFKDLEQQTRRTMVKAGRAKSMHGYIYKSFYNYFSKVLFDAGAALIKTEDGMGDIPLFQIA